MEPFGEGGSTTYRSLHHVKDVNTINYNFQKLPWNGILITQCCFKAILDILASEVVISLQNKLCSLLFGQS